MKQRRIGCMAFGVVWAVLFVVTNFGLALGDQADGPHDRSTNPLSVVFWGEIAVLVVGLALFVRAEMKDADL